MPNIPSNRDYMNDIEIAADSPITESTMNKIGANINALLDSIWQFFEFTSNDTWICPENVFNILIELIGGGGGGAGGDWDAISGAGGKGGSSGARVFVNVAVTPGETYTIEIGSGGAGGTGVANSNGNAGSNGGISYFKHTGTVLAYAGGGLGAKQTGDYVDFMGTRTPGGDTNQDGYTSVMGGSGGNDGAENGGGTGGGGGGGGYDAGGNGGGSSTVNPGEFASPGANGSRGSGGGGGGGTSGSNTTGGTGGNGGSGCVRLYYQGTA